MWNRCMALVLVASALPGWAGTCVTGLVPADVLAGNLGPAPAGAFEEVMCVAMGGVDSYDFHALETIQCMAERRKGGEKGVAWVESTMSSAPVQARLRTSRSRLAA